MKLTARQTMIVLLVAAAAVVLLVTRFTSREPSGVPIRVTTDTTDAAAASPTSEPAATAPSSAAATAESPEPVATGDAEDGTDDAPAIRPTTSPAAQEAATAFAAAWLNTYGRTPQTWRASITPRVTPDLAADLADADPGSVPAGGRVGPVNVNVDGSLLTADVDVVAAAGNPETLGALHLTLVTTRGAWLVSEIDWEPRR